MSSMRPNHNSSRARTEVSSDMRKLGKDIKVRILPDAEAKNIKSGSATNIKITKTNPANSTSWERNVPRSLDGNLISSVPLPPARPASNSLPNVTPKPQVHQTLRPPYQRSMLKRKFNEGVEDRQGKSVVLRQKVSCEGRESVGLDLVSKEIKRDKKCSGEVDFSSNPFSGSVRSSSLKKKFPATEKIASHHEARDLKSRSLSMNKDTLDSGVVNSSPQARNLHAVKASGAILPVESSSTETNVQESSVNKLKYIIHTSPLNGPALQATWKGNFEIPNLPFNTNVVTYEGLSAHPSAKVSRKAYEFSKQLPAAIHFTFHPLFSYLSETFPIHIPDRNDIALYFYPDKTDKSNYARLLKFLEQKDMMLKSCMGDVNLLVFPSTILKKYSQKKLGGSYFMWGFFCVNKVKSISGYAAPASSTSVAGNS